MIVYEFGKIDAQTVRENLNAGTVPKGEEKVVVWKDQVRPAR